MSLSETGQAHVIKLGAYALDPVRNVLISAAREAPLTPLATRLLQLLASKPGEVFERAAIIDALWRGDWLVGDPALNRLVSEVRRAAGDSSRAPSLIQTVPRQGYRLIFEPDGAAAKGAGPARVHTFAWPQAWRLANATLAIVIGGLALLLALALLARLFR